MTDLRTGETFFDQTVPADREGVRSLRTSTGGLKQLARELMGDPDAVEKSLTTRTIHWCVRRVSS